MTEIWNFRSLWNKFHQNHINDIKKAAQTDIPQIKQEYNKNEKVYAEYGRCLEKYPIEKKTILYESFAGRGMICNPYAIFRYLLTQKKFFDYTHVWVIEDFEDNAAVMAEYAEYSNVKFVLYMSDEYLKYLAVSKYLINNVGFMGFFSKRKEQIYLNTWHGIPMKTIGFDIPGGNISSGNSAKNLLSADYLISAGSYMTNIAYLKSYKLNGILPGTILEGGFPRNDAFFYSDRQKIFQRLIRHGVEIDPNKKIILYAPTWKGSQYSQPQDDIEEYLKLIKIIERSVDTSKYQVLVKPHQIVYYHMKNSCPSQKNIIPAILDTNEILSVTDILVSDYSSIYFDFLISGRPIVFFIPDLHEFTDYRGLYFGIDNLPGPVLQTYEELEECFRVPEKIGEGYEQKYQAERQRMCPFDDGNVCARTVKNLFKRTRIRPFKTFAKKKILLYAGNFGDNMSTFALLSVLNIINTEKYDFTILAQSGGSKESSSRIQNLPSTIRVLYWKPFYVASETEWSRHCLYQKNCADKSVYPAAFYQREISRAFGNAKFDAVISFCTDNSVFNEMMLSMKKTKKILWTTEMENIPKHLLKFADRIICSSLKSTDNFAKYQKKTVYLQPPVDIRYVQDEKETAVITTIHGKKMFAASIKKSESTCAKAVFLPVPDPHKETIVSLLHFLGKEAYEKLFSVFAQLCSKGQDYQLILIGESPLKSEMLSLAERLGIREHIIFTGNLDHPLAYASLCTHFVMETSSETGNPVILCAKSLMKSVVSDANMLLQPEDLNTEVSFNAEQYNRQIQKEWEKLLEVWL